MGLLSKWKPKAGASVEDAPEVQAAQAAVNEVAAKVRELEARDRELAKSAREDATPEARDAAVARLLQGVPPETAIAPRGAQAVAQARGQIGEALRALADERVRRHAALQAAKSEAGAALGEVEQKAIAPLQQRYLDALAAVVEAGDTLLFAQQDAARRGGAVRGLTTLTPPGNWHLCSLVIEQADRVGLKVPPFFPRRIDEINAAARAEITPERVAERERHEAQLAAGRQKARLVLAAQAGDRDAKRIVDGWRDEAANAERELQRREARHRALGGAA